MIDTGNHQMIGQCHQEVEAPRLEGKEALQEAVVWVTKCHLKICSTCSLGEYSGIDRLQMLIINSAEEEDFKAALAVQEYEYIHLEVSREEGPHLKPVKDSKAILRLGFNFFLCYSYSHSPSSLNFHPCLIRLLQIRAILSTLIQLQPGNTRLPARRKHITSIITSMNSS